MSNFVYESWLADRGMLSPGSQPHDVLGAKLDTNSRMIILSNGSAEDKEQQGAQLQKLAMALENNSSPVSWVLLVKDASRFPLTTLRSLMPTLSRAVFLDDSAMVDPEQFITKNVEIASRPLQIFYGPSLATMNTNSKIKSTFWGKLREWNS